MLGVHRIIVFLVAADCHNSPNASILWPLGPPAPILRSFLNYLMAFDWRPDPTRALEGGAHLEIQTGPLAHLLHGAIQDLRTL